MNTEEEVLSFPLSLPHSYENRCLWTLICSSIKHNLPLFVDNIIIIKRSGEINIVSRHALGNTVLYTCSACNITMRRSFIRFVNQSVINQTQDPAARMIVVTCTIKKTSHHAKPRGREENIGNLQQLLGAGAILRITICVSFCAKGKETCKQPSKPSRQQHIYTPHKVS